MQRNVKNRYGVDYPFTLANTVMFVATAFSAPIFKDFLDEDNSYGQNFGTAAVGMWITMSAGMLIGNLAYATYKYPEYRDARNDQRTAEEAVNPFVETFGKSFLILRMWYSDETHGCGDPFYQRDTIIFDFIMLSLSSAIMLSGMSSAPSNTGEQILRGLGTTLSSYFGTHLATAGVNILFRSRRQWEEGNDLGDGLLGQSQTRRGSIAPHQSRCTSW